MQFTGTWMRYDWRKSISETRISNLPINQKGLTLIEVLVSFVILASLITVSSQLLTVSVDGIFRVRSEAKIAQALPNIRAILSDLDLSKKPNGEAVWGKISYRWETKVLKQAPNWTNVKNPMTPGPPVPGKFLMKLYEIQVTLHVLSEDQSPKREFTFLETQFTSIEPK
jgi:prepilin-type N-terminal cleavage/methylation domain-containing protein